MYKYSFSLSPFEGEGRTFILSQRERREKLAMMFHR